MPSSEHPAGPRWVPVLVLLVLATAGPTHAQDGRRTADDGERIQARVLRVEDEVVVLDKGRADGVRERTVFDVYRPARVVRLPLTDEVVYVREEVVAQATVVAVEPSIARARLRRTGQVAVEADDMAVSNPFAVPENQAPFVRSTERSRESAPAGRSIRVTLDVGNEPGEAWYVRWSAEGGRLSTRRTRRAEVVWDAPTRAGTYEVVAEIVDAAGETTRHVVELRSTGTPAGGGPTVYEFERYRTGAGSLEQIRDLDFDGSNGAWVLDGWRSRLVRVDDAWNPIEESEPWNAVWSYDPRRIQVADGDVYVLDREWLAVHRFPWDPKMFRQEPEVRYGGEGYGNGTLDDPVDFCVTERGEVCIVDRARGNIQVFAEDGRFLLSIGKGGAEAGQLQRPVAIARGTGDRLYVLDDGRKRVVVFEGFRYLREFPVGVETDVLRDLAIDPFDGGIHVLEATTGTVRPFSAGGEERSPRTGGGEEGSRALGSPLRMRFDRTERLYVVGSEGRVLHRTAPGEGRILGRLDLSGVPGDRVSSTADGRLAILDRNAARVRVLGRDGFVTTSFGGWGSDPGTFADPVDVACLADGRVAVLDRGTGVKTFTPDGTPDRVDPVEGPARHLGTGPARSALVVVFPEAGRRPVVLGPGGESIGERFPFPEGGLPGPPLVGALDARGGLVLLMGARGAVLVPGDRAHLFRPAVPWPTDLAVTPSGRLCATVSGEVVVLGPDLDEVARISEAQEAPAPVDLAVDDHGAIYVHDEYSGRIAEFAAR